MPDAARDPPRDILVATMAAETDWTIRPREGLGRLEFGMSPAQVDSLSATYGTITGRGADRIADDILRETLAMFGDAMSDDEKQALLPRTPTTAHPQTASPKPAATSCCGTKPTASARSCPPARDTRCYSTAGTSSLYAVSNHWSCWNAATKAPDAMPIPKRHSTTSPSR